MKNPGQVLPDAMQPLMGLGKIVHASSVPATTLEIVHLRISQINGCAWCVDFGLEKTKETPRRLAAVAVWRDAPFFSEAERAALDLAESATRLADRADPVPDAVWSEAAKHYDEKQLAALVVHIALVNLYNRLNVTTRQVAGERHW
jgi:AhpD family alkylhydroperoxidase